VIIWCRDDHLVVCAGFENFVVLVIVLVLAQLTFVMLCDIVYPFLLRCFQ
jgi:hypothetical protein